MNKQDKEITTTAIKIACAFLLSVACSFLYVSNASAAPNYLLAEGTTACKHLKTLSIVARIQKDEYVPDMQRSEASNDCTLPMKEDKPVTAFDIGVTAKVEFFALGKLDVYYVNERDLISLSEDNPKR